MLRQSNAQAMKATAICSAAKSRHAFQPREKSIQPTAMDITSIEVMPTPMWISTLSHVGSSVPYISEAIPKIAAAEGLTNGYRVITNCGEDGCQTVRHLHFHLLGGRKLPEQMA